MGAEDEMGQGRRGLRASAHRQAGFVREAILVFIVLTIVGVFLLDTLSVYSAHRNLKAQAGDAAAAAAQEYATSVSDTAAQSAAAGYLEAHGATLVAFRAHHENDGTWYTVTAQTNADTYVFRYIARLPWGIGSWMDRLLHPKETNDNRP
jgi:Flp pilus assembly protein TadG